MEKTYGPLFGDTRISTNVQNSVWDSDEVARFYAYLLNEPGFLTKQSSATKVVAIADSLIIGAYHQERGDEDERIAKDFVAFTRKVPELLDQSDLKNIVLSETLGGRRRKCAWIR